MRRVKVHVGNAGPFLYGCIRYDTGDVNLALIIGLAVGLGLLLIIIVAIVVIVCVYRRRGKEKRAADDGADDLQMSPVVVESRPTDAQRHAER